MDIGVNQCDSQYRRNNDLKGVLDWGTSSMLFTQARIIEMQIKVQRNLIIVYACTTPDVISII